MRDRPFFAAEFLILLILTSQWNCTPLFTGDGSDDWRFGRLTVRMTYGSDDWRSDDWRFGWL